MRSWPKFSDLGGPEIENFNFAQIGYDSCTIFLDTPPPPQRTLAPLFACPAVSPRPRSARRAVIKDTQGEEACMHSTGWSIEVSECNNQTSESECSNHFSEVEESGKLNFQNSSILFQDSRMMFLLHPAHSLRLSWTPVRALQSVSSPIARQCRQWCVFCCMEEMGWGGVQELDRF